MHSFGVDGFMVEQGHCFALYASYKLSGDVGNVISIDEDALVHRIINVLRLKVGEALVLFDAHVALRGRIALLGKKRIDFIVEQRRVHKPLHPEIHWFLPILERDSFEAALSHATVMGVTSITPVITTQSARQVRLSLERQVKIMAAAAEQSKQYVFPTMHPTVSFDQAFAQRNRQVPLVLFDDDGEPALPILSHLAELKPSSLAVLSGPEGGLTVDEITIAREQGALVCALTPTILRAWVAVSLGAGLIRSCVVKH